MPESDPDLLADVRAALDAFRDAGGDLDDPAQRRAIEDLTVGAPSLLSLLRVDPGILRRAVERPLELAPSSRAGLRAELGSDLAQLEPGDAALNRLLRRFRHRAVIRIALREIRSLADVEATSAEMANLASVVIDAALQAHLKRAFEAHGPALDSAGEPVPLVLLGMGKLGGSELNLGSDVDLIPFYETDDAACREDDMSVHELYTRVVRRTMKALSEVTEDGFCFRVDLRLRPEGTRGPLVNSLASAERYYESWGRTWERAALLRAAPVAGDLAFGERVLEALRGFVYRRNVDPSLPSRMNEMLLRSRRELRTHDRDVKLGEGGIREAEFFVQSLQLVWGGQHPELRVPGTLDALERLRGAGLVSQNEAEALSHSWGLLRRVEHRIHVFTGYQTHRLMDPGPQLERFAVSLGFADAAELERELTEARATVRELFLSLLEPQESATDAWDDLLDHVAANAPIEEVAELLSARLPNLADPFEAATHLARLARRANSPLGPVQHARQPALGRLLLTEIAGVANPESGLLHLAEFFTRLAGPWSYDRLLLERPRLTRRLIGLFGASATLSRALIGHPEDVDLLLSSGAPDPEEIAALHDKLEPDPDPENMIAELRRLKRALTLSTGLAYVGSEIELAGVTSRLSELAEHQVRAAVLSATVWAEGRFGRGGQNLVVIAMGKLGARELGFGGDLDLVFLFGEDGETEPTKSGRSVTLSELYTRVAQRTMQLLRERDAEGAGYETDIRLRPSGSKGTLVVTLNAFDRYHERGAAAWERQALIRARPISGPEEVRRAAMLRFERLAYEGEPTPKEELTHARSRLQSELAGETPRRYHPKLGYGGLTDVELLVQWLQMRHGQDHPSVRTPSTLQALHALEDEALVTGAEASALRLAYDFLRRVEQSLKLFDEHREPYLEPLGRSGAHVARRLGLLARDGLSPEQALDATYRQHAEATRACFEGRLGAVDALAPWQVSDS